MDLNRFSFRNLINILSSFQILHSTSLSSEEKPFLSGQKMSDVHHMASRYISEYISTNYKDING
jgi:hypothetical protein